MIIEHPSVEKIHGLRGLWKEAFGDSDEFLDAFFERGYSEERSFCALCEGQVVGALYWFDAEWEGQPVAYLYAIATAESYRGRGICQALMRHTHARLKAQGYRAAILVPGSASLFSFYEKLGYRTVCTIGETEAIAGATGLSLKELSPEEYARERRSFLPWGGVLQEGATVSFLATSATFYRGDGFLLTARVESEHLVGIELLGEKKMASAVVSALGCRTGSFRTVGEDRPFAMLLPLSEEDFIQPSYFGLALDL
jgi:predicted N-acetyltransferase YhbS